MTGGSSGPWSIAGTRVELRPPTSDDRDEFVAAMLASRRFHRPWLTAPTTVAGFDALLQRALDPAFEPMLVRRLEDCALVGFFNVSYIIRGPLQSAFLGYGAVGSRAGAGYMTEGLGLVLRRVFVGLRLHRLEANIQPGNAASIALVSRCGFVNEGFSAGYLNVGGRWRDHERWAIRAEQWRSGDREPGRPAAATTDTAN